MFYWRVVLYCKYSGTEDTLIEYWIVEKRYLWGLEISATVYLQQSRTACYIELLCWYVYVCLVRIEIYDNVMYIVYICTLAQAYTWNIAIESWSCDMMPKYWVIYEMSWLIAMPRCWVPWDWVAWQMRSTWVGRQVKRRHSIGLLGQHIESSCILRHHYWNDENC